MAKKKTTRGAIAQLQRELDRHRQAYDDLASLREEVLAELEVIEEEMQAYEGLLGSVSDSSGAPKKRKKRGRPAGSKTSSKKTGAAKGPGRGRRGARGNNTMTLHEAMTKALSGKTLGVGEIADQVKRLGYKTKSNNFKTIVNQTLIKDPKTFKKVARGQYTAR